MNNETPDISTDEKALEYVLETLRTNARSFKYTPQEDNRNLFYREPLPDGDMTDEPSRFIHMCNPMKLAEALVAREPKRAVAYSGYVNEGECMRCGELN